MPFGAELTHAIRIGSKWVRMTTVSIWDTTKYSGIKDTRAATGFQKPVVTHAIKGEKERVDVFCRCRLKPGSIACGL